MQFANYASFREAVRNLIEGDQIGNTFSTATLDLIVGLAEERIYRDLRASTMVDSAVLTVTSNTAPLPADLIELKALWQNRDEPIEIIPLDRLNRVGTNGGNTYFAALDGDNLRFAYEASGTVNCEYYARPTAMKDETTWANQTTLARYPDVFLYGAVCEAMPFLGEDARVGLFEQKYSQALTYAKADERWRAYGGSPLRVRAR